MITLKTYQENAVNELFGYCKDLLNKAAQNNSKRHKIVFEAPTGSGKTVMASALLDKLVATMPVSPDFYKQDLAIIWIAPNKLHLQAYSSFRNFFNETRNLSPRKWEDVNPQDGLQHGDVLFLNWDSINSENNLLIRDSETRRNLSTLVRQSRLKNMALMVVIDEEHLMAGIKTNAEKVLNDVISADVELRISATPISKQEAEKLTSVNRSDVIEEEMIKSKVMLNPGVKANQDSFRYTTNTWLLNIALEKRRELKEKYQALGSDVNPLLLIQLPNDNKSMNNDDKSVFDEVKTYLENTEDITVGNGKLAIWLSDEKTPGLDAISRNDDVTEVLLFKQAIALGWDCPRAHVLLVFRNLNSQNFTVQTVGRILRMPEQHHYSDDDLNTGFIYSNLSAEAINHFILSNDEYKYLSTIIATRRNGVTDLELHSQWLTSTRIRNRLNSKFADILEEVMRIKLSVKTPYSELFDEDGNPVDFEKNEEIRVLNFDMAGKVIRLDVKNVFITIPANTPIISDYAPVEIVQKERKAVTQMELRSALMDFCLQHLGNLAPVDSIGIMINAVKRVMESLFGFTENETVKVVLYHENKPKFAEIFDVAISRFIKMLGDEKKEVHQEEGMWQLPFNRFYNLDSQQPVEDIFNHALLPFYENKNVSRPEYDFARYCDKNDAVEWWYKNGDSGREHFAITYTASDGSLRSFFVDFIVKLKPNSQGKTVICLFDTKSENSDPEGPAKQKALQEYIDKRNVANATEYASLVGGLLIKDGDNWRYPGAAVINNTVDLGGWAYLDFDKMRKD
ncbi:MAG: DEAD/DEAH box helicase family protein [Bacteroidales bacterium]|nr:DEAD/DEAH box helicase family protein [Candidatus Physcocola equi]